MTNMECPCKRTNFERHGDCEKCREHHYGKRSGKSLPRCEKLIKKEQRRALRAEKRGK